jgi:hypothetical protein
MSECFFTGLSADAQCLRGRISSQNEILLAPDHRLSLVGGIRGLRSRCGTAPRTPRPLTKSHISSTRERASPDPGSDFSWKLQKLGESDGSG